MTEVAGVFLDQVGEDPAEVYVLAVALGPGRECLVGRGGRRSWRQYISPAPRCPAIYLWFHGWPHLGSIGLVAELPS